MTSVVSAFRRTVRSRTVIVMMLLAAGCARRTSPAAEYKDAIPPPAEPLVREVPTVGRYGGRFVLGQTVNPKSFNGIMAVETSTTDVTNLLFTALVDYDNGKQEFGPLLAKSWDVSPDGMTWTFHLRQGAKFSDGHPLTSEDVLFSFQVVMDPTLHPPIQDQMSMNGKHLEASAPDPYTFVIKSPAPNSSVLDTFCTGGFVVMPKHVLEPAFKSGNFASSYNLSTPLDQIVTSGPWRIAQYAPGEKTVLGRNPYWFGFDQEHHRLPYLNELTFLQVPDQDAADLKFRSGELSGLENTKAENYKWYEDHQKDGNFTLYHLGPELRTHFFWFNLNKVQPPRPGEKTPPGRKLGDPYTDPVKYAWFNNVVFRRAVSMAVDRDAMIPSIFFGHGVKNWSDATPGNKVWYHSDLPHDDYNPAEAKKLLASLGWKDSDGDGVLEDAQGHPISFAMRTNADNKLRVGMANFIKDDLAKVGIKMTLDPVDFNTLITNLRYDFQYDAILLGLQSGVPPTPANGQNVWRSSGESHQWYIRQQKPATPEEAHIDQLMDKILSTQDLEARKVLWKEIETIINQQAWLIWLPILDYSAPVSNRFGNVQPSPLAHRLLWNVERIYMK